MKSFPCLKSTRTLLRPFLVVVSLFFLGTVPAKSGDGNKTAIAAAASLNHVLVDIISRYREITGENVQVSFGSSGNFTRQILQGAPFGLFLSADKAYIEKLQQSGVTDGLGDVFARGRIAYFVPEGSVLANGEGLKGLKTAVEEGLVRRFVIANPEHAPYGRAAMEILENAGLWKRLGDKLVLGENASQATQFTVSGSADGGLIALSQALTPKISSMGTYALIPEGQHAPLWHAMVLIKGADEKVRRFYDFLQTEPVRFIFEQYGYTSP